MSLTLDLEFSPMGRDVGTESQTAWLIPDRLAHRYATDTVLDDGRKVATMVYDDRGWDRFLRMLACAPDEEGPSLAQWLELGPVLVMTLPAVRTVLFGYPVETQRRARAWGCGVCQGYAVHVERLEHVPDLPKAAEMDKLFGNIPGCRGRVAMNAVEAWMRHDLPLLVAADALREVPEVGRD